MGTRHIIVVVKNEEIRVAQYGQWDGNPDGTGLSILEFLQHNNGENVRVLEEKIDLCRLHQRTGEDDTHPGLVAASSSYPDNFNRNTGWRILEIINKSVGPLYLIDDFEFAKDTVFCEWAWVIDLDNRTLDAYEHPKFLGFADTTANSETGAPPEALTKPRSNDQGIFAKLQTETVTKVASFNLDDLPTEDDFRIRFTMIP